MNLPIGTKVTLKCWPVPATVIGHWDGSPIIQPESCVLSDDQIVSYTDPVTGLTKMPFSQKLSD